MIFNNYSRSNFLLQAGTFEFKVAVVLEAAQGLEVGLHDCICSQVICWACLQGYNGCLLNNRYVWDGMLKTMLLHS